MSTPKIHAVSVYLDPEGKPAMCEVAEHVIDPNGNAFRLTPRQAMPADADVVAFLADVNTGAINTIKERDATIAERDTTITERLKQIEELTANLTGETGRADTAEAKVEELTATIATMQSDAEALRAEYATSVSDLQAEHTAAMADAQEQYATGIAAKNAEIELLKNPPRQPRVLYPSEFINLFTDEELDGIDLASTPLSRKARRVLFTQLQVDLDNPLLAQLVGGLAQTGLLTAERAKAIMDHGKAE